MADHSDGSGVASLDAERVWVSYESDDRRMKKQALCTTVRHRIGHRLKAFIELHAVATYLPTQLRHVIFS